MVTIRIYQILQSIERKKLNRFTKFINSPYFNINKSLNKLGELLVTSIKSEKVYLIEYPTLSTYKNGNKTNYCEAMLTRVFEVERFWTSDGVGQVDETEAKWVVDYAIPRLNNAINKACQEYNWNYIGGVLDKFEGRGLCVGNKFKESWYKGNPFPRTLPNNNGPYGRWVRQAKESKEIQECHGFNVKKCRTMFSMGMVHPNEFGHKAIAESFLSIF